MRIDGVPVHTGGAPYVIAEISCNHVGDKARALRLIHLAAQAGADAVKFQLFTPDEMADPAGPPLTEGPWAGRTLYDLYTEAQTPREWFPDLFIACGSYHVTPIVSVLSLDGLAYLQSINCPAYKIPSPELGWTDLVRAAGATGKPVLVSTGMGEKREIEAAVACVPRDQLVLLHCVSAYPTPLAAANLHHLDHLIRRWGLDIPIGLSDHSATFSVPAMAVAMGAAVLEVHIMSDEGPLPLDAQFSWSPDAFRRLVCTVRDAYAAMQPPVVDVEAASRAYKRRQQPDGRWLRG